MTTARYVQRLGRIFEALQVLDLYPAGLELIDLAELLGCSADEVRTDLKAHNDGTDLGPAGMTAWVEFLSRLPADAQPSGEPQAEFGAETADDDADDDLMVDPDDATAVRLHRATIRGGSSGLSVSEVGAILVAAEDVLRVEPGNAALAEVVAQLRSRWLPAVTEVWRPTFERLYEADLTLAIEERRRVRIVYDRAWQPGLIDRVIEPYALVRTHRGFEVDAGPVREDGHVRTYLVGNVVSLELLEEHFTRPDNADDLCARNRRSTRVEIVVPKERQWVTEFLAESVTVMAVDDDVSVALDLLEPVAMRVGLVLLQAGPEAFVSAPAHFRDADDALARELLAHHGLD